MKEDVIKGLLAKGFVEIPSSTHKAQTYLHDETSTLVYVLEDGKAKYGSCFSRALDVPKDLINLWIQAGENNGN